MVLRLCSATVKWMRHAPSAGRDSVLESIMSSGPEPTLSEQRREVAALVPQAACTILDLGCGAGGLGWWLKQRRAEVHVTGVDGHGPGPPDGRLDRWYRADLEVVEIVDQPWWAAAAYDCIVLADVLEHLRCPDALLKQIRPLLRPEGCLVLSIPNGLLNVAVLYDLLIGGDFPYYRAGRDPFVGPPSNLRAYDHLRWFTPKSIQRLLRECGYQAGHWNTVEMTAPPAMRQFAAEVGGLIQAHRGPDEAAIFQGNAFVCQYVIHTQPDWTVPG